MIQYVVFVTFYIIQSFCCFELIKNKILARRTFAFLAFLEIGILLGCRSVNVGEDTYGYFQFFNYLLYNFDWHIFSYSFEPGYILFNKLIQCFSSSAQSLFLISGFFISFSVIKFIVNNTKNCWLGILIYITLGNFFFAMTGLRQSLALAIWLFAYPALKERRLLPFLFISLLAISFHYSICFFICFYPLYGIKYNPMGIFRFLIKIFPLLVVVSCILGGLYSGYRYSVWAGWQFKIANISYLATYLFLSFFIYFSFHIAQKTGFHFGKESERQEFCFLLSVSLLLVFLALLSFGATIIARTFSYLTIFYTLSIPSVLQMQYSKNRRILLYILIILFLVSFQGIIQYYRPDWTAVIPYEFYWQNPYNIRTKITQSSFEYI